MRVDSFQGAIRPVGPGGEALLGGGGVDVALTGILDRKWLHPGSVVVADNVKLPGAPAYRAYMQAQEAKTWRTVEHPTHLEYQSLIKGLVLESEYLG